MMPSMPLLWATTDNAAHEYFISFQSQTLFSSNLQVTVHNGSLERFEDFQEY